MKKLQALDTQVFTMSAGMPAPEVATAARGRDRAARALVWLAGAVLVWSFLKGLVTSIHDWPLTELQLTYHFGIIKRGLVGTALRIFLVDKPANNVREIATAFGMGLDLALLALAIRELRERLTLADPLLSRRLLRAAALLTFAASPVVWNLALCLGYLDVPLMIIGLVLVRARSPLVALPLALVAVLVHELSALLIVPLLLLLAFSPEQPWGLERRRAATVGVGLLVIAGVTLWLSGHGPSPQMEAQMVASHWTPESWVHTLVGFQREPIKTSFTRMLQNPHPFKTLAPHALPVLPATLVTCALGLLQLWSTPLTRRARVVGSVLYLGASVPVVFSVTLAFDLQRLLALSNAQAFLGYCLLDRRLAKTESRPGKISLGLVLALALAVFAADLLMDVKFTYLPPMTRVWPSAWNVVLVDPFAKLSAALLGK